MSTKKYLNDYFLFSVNRASNISLPSCSKDFVKKYNFLENFASAESVKKVKNLPTYKIVWGRIELRILKVLESVKG